MHDFIARRQQLAKWSADLERRDRTRRALDFFHNRVFPYIEERIDGMVDREEARELKKYIEHDNITQRMIDGISLVFKEKARIRALRRDRCGRKVPDPAAQVMIDDLLSQCRFQASMKEVEKLSKLLYDVAVLPQVRDGRVELDIITGEKAFVEQDPDNPTRALRFYYQVGMREQSPAPHRVDLYHCWSREGKFSCEIMADGTPDPATIRPIPHLDYPGRTPVVMFRSYLPIDGFWSETVNPIVEKNLAIDLKRTDLAMAEAYNIPQLFTVGSRENQELKRGRIFKIDIPRNDMGEAVGDAKYLSPGERLADQNALIADRIEQLGLSLGLSRAIITGQSATSGYELALSKYEIVERCRSERDYYADSVRELMEVLVHTANQGLGWDIPEDLCFAVDFGEIRFAQSDLDRERCRQLRLQNGSASRVDFLMEDDPELDLESAKLKIQEIERIGGNAQHLE
jgi:hypothetical protein